MMKFDDMAHVSGFWFVYGDQKDFLACVFQGHDGHWRALFRFRYYGAGRSDPFDGDDRKSWFELDPRDGDRPKLEGAMHLVAAEIVKKGFGGPICHVPIDGDAKKAAELLMVQPWAHVKIEYPTP
jgi:hypothetical protein